MHISTASLVNHVTHLPEGSLVVPQCDRLSAQKSVMKGLMTVGEIHAGLFLHTLWYMVNSSRVCSVVCI